MIFAGNRNFKVLYQICALKTFVYKKKTLIAYVLSIGLLSVGCGSLSKGAAEAQSQSSSKVQQADNVKPVDAVIARTGLLRQQPQYIGTTVPFRTVSLRSQAEGQLLSLNVDVGDAVKYGQLIGQLDDALLKTALNQAEAQLATLNSEVAQAIAQVSNARVEVERLRLIQVQAEADSQRQQLLSKQGAISLQTAEKARTESLTADQAVRAAQERVRTQQQAVRAAQNRLTVQKSVIAQAKERRSYAQLTSPITGVVLAKSTEPGNLLQPGNEVLRIGDFRSVKVLLQVSEKELSNVRLGQSVQVRLDALPNQTYVGKVIRISPDADATARLVPVEVMISNSQGKIGSGLLARVNFNSQAQQRVIVPEIAIQQLGGQGQGSNTSSLQNSQGRVFVVTQTEGKTAVKARSVRLGERADGKVEILSGLQTGERFVTRSGKPLQDGDRVRLSILSESNS
ncbi:efflux RND transporter periplasmic adaptor subunit [Aetokthonos hydrillicola Thurmond2011]|jgi:RND family efflux transporter MFP subunit|uniref:Efflux RND transporter periplasmic adaptor subunit n=1 Tax=Aetokthonos hydrillicola Thurmond2011 TaxID=2712845 RepID=A0AAP5M9F8_9CYAN|nr:efflux RND transporter periplasmic adaptor subunit [Aetokthonos hydrillicola]MBO3460939.1 efflux RND transporter periplasmic adaptor subunit [Aetokthonos hydrillicola CCALA 1050]MBW4583610.1 efflux RND transporter periplasmic adaptor subunit [Aetokthonos hydrillicola CCALA 1050]MDR9895697.1 efflux RND transporter periplasmic adaptor subunit [Aetokthonos hydrillicola Thurmond2011]